MARRFDAAERIFMMLPRGCWVRPHVAVMGENARRPPPSPLRRARRGAMRDGCAAKPPGRSHGARAIVDAMVASAPPAPQWRATVARHPPSSVRAGAFEH